MSQYVTETSEIDERLLDAELRERAVDYAVRIISVSSGTIDPRTWKEVRDEVYEFLSTNTKK